MHLHLLARYPFLPQAGEWIAKDGPALEDLLTDPVYAPARARGRERVVRALEEGQVATPRLSRASSPRELLEELLASAYARILVSAAEDAYVVRRHALAEAVRVKELLENEEDDGAFVAASQVVGLAFEREGDKWRMHFTDYLKQAVHLKDLEWKLVLRPLQKGFVSVDAKAASRLVQEGLRRRIEGELPRPISDEVKAAVEADLTPIRHALAQRLATLPAANYGKVELANMPPCMSLILSELQRGVNVAHNARFAIVTFLHKIGMSSEEIITLFSQAPDFREDLTRYQVEHITGVSSSTTYSVPGCDNLQTFNLCHPNELCRSRTKAGKARVVFPGDHYRYMAEARKHVEAVVARVPVDTPEPLVFAAALNYALLKRLEAIAADPGFARLDGAALLRLAAARQYPVKIEGLPEAPKLVLTGAEPWMLPNMLGEEWVRSAEVVSSAPDSNPTETRRHGDHGDHGDVG